MYKFTILLVIASVSSLLGASEPEIDTNWDAALEWAKANPVSYLRVELETPGGPLPFVIQSPSIPQTLEEGIGFEIEVLNGDERLARQMVVEGGGIGGPATADIKFDQYGSYIKAFGTGSCTTPSILPQHYFRSGTWRKYRGENNAALLDLKIIAVDSADDRFDPKEDVEKPAAYSGRWSVKFDSSDDLAVGSFVVDKNQIATGTFLTTTGDYRYLAGRVDGNLMRLSTFDGAHAFLFHARMQDDGTIEGDFWSGNWWHETWKGVRDDDAELPDAFGQTVIADPGALEDMVFKNLDGEPTRVLDLFGQSNAKARIIEVFGTWCPNCSDAGRELVSLKEQYGDDLAIVGLAFEITDDFDRSVTQVRRHHEHIGTDWPILIAGLNDKDKASAALPVLDKVRSYPTLIFLDRNNQVQAVYTGFSGPATGEAYIKQRERFEALIDGMIE